MKRIALVIASVLALSGCATAPVHLVQPRSVSAHAHVYAAALAEAFDMYESKVQDAAMLTYSSNAEAFAVMQTLSDRRFTWELQQALARRGLSISDLARYAEAHPTFVDEQQRLYTGRLERLEATVASLASRVKQDDTLLLTAD